MGDPIKRSKHCSDRHYGEGARRSAPKSAWTTNPLYTDHGRHELPLSITLQQSMTDVKFQAKLTIGLLQIVKSKLNVCSVVQRLLKLCLQKCANFFLLPIALIGCRSMRK